MKRPRNGGETPLQPLPATVSRLDMAKETIVGILLAAWAGVWWLWRRLLAGRIHRHWMPGSEFMRREALGWAPPPEGALSCEGERLWWLRLRVTLWGFVGWMALAGLALAATA